MPGETPILAEDIAYSYNEILAVDRISFQVDTGEILGFLGPNGAGKTTTLKMLVGLLASFKEHSREWRPEGYIRWDAVYRA